MNIFLPFGLEFNLPRRAEMIAELLLPLAGPEVYASTPSEQRALRTIAEVRHLKEDMYTIAALPRTLQEANVKQEQLEDIAKLAINDGSAMMNPEELRLEDALEIAKRAFDHV